ncbi:RNA recognition motif domain [Macleaya cordata]|uniref:RNA recognition motif domain n=1 Tax=Macleaya cordata TaxID=56857 RepID=A0A200Q5K3_MACCD|nr:RNA recognition motif domain [Macleaya cordata]
MCQVFQVWLAVEHPPNHVRIITEAEIWGGAARCHGRAGGQVKLHGAEVLYCVYLRASQRDWRSFKAWRSCEGWVPDLPIAPSGVASLGIPRINPWAGPCLAGGLCVGFLYRRRRLMNVHAGGGTTAFLEALARCGIVRGELCRDHWMLPRYFLTGEAYDCMGSPSNVGLARWTAIYGYLPGTVETVNPTCWTSVIGHDEVTRRPAYERGSCWRESVVLHSQPCAAAAAALLIDRAQPVMAHGGPNSTPNLFQVSSTAPVLVPSSKSAKKGKREAEDELQNQAGAKKKIKIVQKKDIKKKEEISTSEDFSSDEEPRVRTKKKDRSVGVPTKRGKPATSFDSEEFVETETKVAIPPPKKPAAASRNGSVAVSNKKTESSDSSDSEDSSSDEEDKNLTKVASKLNETPVVVVATKNISAVVPQKKDESSDGSDSDSSSDEDDKNSAKFASKINQTPIAVAATKNTSAVVRQEKHESSDGSDLDSSSDEDDKSSAKAGSEINQIPVAAAAAAKIGSAMVPQKNESGDSFDSDSSSDEDVKNSALVASKLNQTPVAAAAAPKNGSAVVLQKKDESSDSFVLDSSSDEDDINSVQVASKINQIPVAAVAATATKNGAAVVPQKKDESSDSFDSDSSSEEDDKNSTQVASSINQTPVFVVASAAAKNGSACVPQKKDESSDSFDSDSSSDEDDETAGKVTSQAMKVPVPAPKNVPVVPAGSMQTVPSKSAPGPTNRNQVSTSESSLESVSSDDEVKGDSDEEMVDAGSPKTNNKGAITNSEQKAPKTPATPQVQNTGSKTLFVGNLSFSIEREDLEEFFKDAGEIIDIRFPINKDGSFKGYGYVDFATEAAAQKAFEMNGQDVLGRAVRLQLLHEMDSSTSHTGEMGGKGQGKIIFVRGFDRSVGIDQIKSTLEVHFGSCGEISRLSIPKDYDTGAPMGYAHIEFTDGGSLAKALELNGSKLGDYALIVKEAMPRADNHDGAGSGRQGGRGDGGGRSGGRRGGRGVRFVGGGRFLGR